MQLLIVISRGYILKCLSIKELQNEQLLLLLAGTIPLLSGTTFPVTCDGDVLTSIERTPSSTSEQRDIYYGGDDPVL